MLRTNGSSKSMFKNFLLCIQASMKFYSKDVASMLVHFFLDKKTNQKNQEIPMLLRTGWRTPAWNFGPTR